MTDSARKQFESAIHKLVHGLGWSYTSTTIGNAAQRLIAEGFFIDETGDIASPGGESFGSGIARVWEESPASTGNTVRQVSGTRHPNGLSDADIAAIKDPFRRAEVQAEVEGGCRVVPAWQRGPNAPVTIGEITQRTGLTAEAFAMLDPTRKLEIESEVKFARTGGAQ